MYTEKINGFIPLQNTKNNQKIRAAPAPKKERVNTMDNDNRNDYYEALLEMLKIEDTKPFDREKWEKARRRWLSLERPAPPRERKKAP